MIGAIGELDYFNAYIRLRESEKSKENADRKTGLGGGECRGKLQVPRQDGRVEAKELHKTGADELLIKIAESEGLRIDAGVLDQGTK
ncbi:hypothetical protein B296_00027346 [Ensete ventricosum]|uniref:Uncharacterized protein n=1 Tax=Ensete ventricosum TaxID=4639 RepID=A0A426YBS7_ENSVE|nr:hypothetical protein B296_00027346 [Ensete ventricosum]